MFLFGGAGGVVARVVKLSAGGCLPSSPLRFPPRHPRVKGFLSNGFLTLLQPSQLPPSPPEQEAPASNTKLNLSVALLQHSVK